MRCSNRMYNMVIFATFWSHRKREKVARTSPANRPSLRKSSDGESRAQYNVARMEVQEVFEFEELNRNWNETFEQKQYYVWVPNPKRKRNTKLRASSDAIQRFHYFICNTSIFRVVVCTQYLVHVEGWLTKTILFLVILLNNWCLVKCKQSASQQCW